MAFEHPPPPPPKKNNNNNNNFNVYVYHYQWILRDFSQITLSKASPAQSLQVLVSYFPTNSLSKDNF